LACAASLRVLTSFIARRIESFERWLGRGATMSRQAAFDEIIETSAQWDRKANAEALARELIALGFGEKTPAAILRETWL